MYYISMLLVKVDHSAKNLGMDPYPDPVGKFWGPLGPILDFACGAALQVVSELLRWYYTLVNKGLFAGVLWSISSSIHISDFYTVSLSLTQSHSVAGLSSSSSTGKVASALLWHLHDQPKHSPVAIPCL